MEKVRIFYSPFVGTAYTARVVAPVLNLTIDGPQCKVMEDLGERYLGPSFQLQSHDKEGIWALDQKDPFQRPEGGESVDNVAAGLTKAMSDLETGYQGCVILVVSHGDPLAAISIEWQLFCFNISISQDLRNLVTALPESFRHQITQAACARNPASIIGGELSRIRVIPGGMPAYGALLVVLISGIGCWVLSTLIKIFQKVFSDNSRQ